MNIGDKVRLPNGTKGVITRRWVEGSGWYVRNDGEIYDDGGWCERNLELIEPAAKFKPGDRVRIKTEPERTGTIIRPFVRDWLKGERHWYWKADDSETETWTDEGYWEKIEEDTITMKKSDFDGSTTLDSVWEAGNTIDFTVKAEINYANNTITVGCQKKPLSAVNSLIRSMTKTEDKLGRFYDVRFRVTLEKDMYGGACLKFQGNTFFKHHLTEVQARDFALIEKAPEPDVEVTIKLSRAEARNIYDGVNQHALHEKVRYDLRKSPRP
jgi:hypothetical protein